MSETIFAKIVRGDIPASKVYETDDVLAFEDVNPQAPVHVLVIPKKPLRTILELQDSELSSSIMAAIKEVVRIKELEANGFRVVVNTGDDGGQTVDHLHFHVIGGRPLRWPPG